ncbi:MAG: hypothetical protein HY277_06565 [Ignavibacteriales bacterium]|nr:hypothetical protein [Ignavibacteriales bacterium]
MNYHRNRGKRSENIIALICLLLAFNSISWPQDRVIGYYPSWMRSTLPPGTIKFEYLTLINHAFAWPLADGTITGGSDLLFPDLNVAVHQAAKRILISLGGAGESGGFSAMAADSTTRTRFVGNLVTFLVSNGYDGVDIDWEFPQTNADKGNLVTLVKQIREVFQNTDSTWLITLAAPAGDYNGRWFDYSALKDDVDWFNVLTYDFHGSWTNHAGHNAPLYAPPTDYDGSVHEAIVYLSNTRRVPKNKIVLGLPFYGKEFIADSMYGESTGATDLLYSAIAPRLQQGSGWTYHWDDVSKVPYLTNSQNSRVVTFDDSVSLSIKCKYAKDNTLSGVMFWAMGQDVIGSNQPLVEAV